MATIANERSSILPQLPPSEQELVYNFARRRIPQPSAMLV